MWWISGVKLFQWKLWYLLIDLQKETNTILGYVIHFQMGQICVSTNNSKVVVFYVASPMQSVSILGCLYLCIM